MAKKKSMTDEPELQRFAMYIAMVVRNALEDFHCSHLSDEQMAELNPIVRNAIYSALWAALHAAARPGAGEFMRFAQRLIPEYWEPPELNEDLRRTLSRLG